MVHLSYTHQTHHHTSKIILSYLVISHQYTHASRQCLVFHPLQFFDGRCAGLFQKDRRTLRGDALRKQRWIVRRTARDQCAPFLFRRRQRRDRRGEDRAIFGGGVVRPGCEFRPAGSGGPRGPQEVRFDDVIERCRRTAM